MSDKTIDIDLKLKATSEGQAFGKLQKQLEELQEEARQTELKIREMKKAGQDTAQMETALKTVRNAIKDVKEEMRLTKPEVDRVKKSILEQAAAAEKSAKEQIVAQEKLQQAERAQSALIARTNSERVSGIARTREQMEKLSQVGSRLAMAGAAILGPSMLAVKNYVDKYKETEPIAMRLVKSQEALDKSAERIGRVFATIIAPEMEKAARFAAQIAQFVEKNPDAAKAALNIGAVLLAAGTLATAVGQIGGTIATLQMLAGGGAAAGAGGTAAAGAAGAVAAPVALVAIAAGVGSFLGIQIGQVLSEAWLKTDLAKSSTKQAAGFLKRTGLDDEFKGIFNALRPIVEPILGKAKPTGISIDLSSQAATTTNQLATAVQTLGQTTKTVSIDYQYATDTLRAMPSKLADFQAQISDLTQTMNDTIAQRASQRANIVAQAQADEARAAQQHAMALAQIENRRRQQVMTATESRDALAVDRANEAAEAEKQEENQRYSAERDAARKSLQLQLQQFDAETRNQIAADRRKLAELQAAANAELALIAQTEALKLAIYQNMLAQIQALGTGGGGSVGASPYANIPAPTAQRAGSETMRQNVNIQMANGALMTQVRREIRAEQNSFARAFKSALQAI